MKTILETIPSITSEQLAHVRGGGDAQRDWLAEANAKLQRREANCGTLRFVKSVAAEEYNMLPPNPPGAPGGFGDFKEEARSKYQAYANAYASCIKENPL